MFLPECAPIINNNIIIMIINVQHVCVVNSHVAIDQTWITDTDAGH